MGNSVVWKVYRHRHPKGVWGFGLDKAPNSLHITFWKWCWVYYEDEY